MDSTIYAFNCIYYSLEFIHNALFIHTVSVTCVYIYGILKIYVLLHPENCLLYR